MRCALGMMRSQSAAGREDVIRQGRFVQVFVPFGHGELRVDDGDALFVAVIQDLQDGQFDLV